MIKKLEHQTKMEFGTGDICIAGGYTENKDKRTGFVIFTNQESRKIGSVGIVKAGEVDFKEYPVVMTFSKKESINAVIRQLEQAKSLMD